MRETIEGIPLYGRLTASRERNWGTVSEDYFILDGSKIVKSWFNRLVVFFLPGIVEIRDPVETLLDSDLGLFKFDDFLVSFFFFTS